MNKIEIKICKNIMHIILQTYVEHSLENNCMSVCMCTTVVGELTES